ncbi:MAG: acyl-CoA/acyl-ACP dehydrogenase [Synergistaceae bacterium]|jgi:alkylation response protein AidB-like acyl-CoA dehydrogenase|nr:acyl-CoA/acyl-ACP dehydrogenase [Synergistaceae bacterium]
MSDTYAEAKKFAEEFVAPYSKEIDKKAEFPKESFEKMGERGYFKLLLPEAVGGLGKTLLDHAEVCRAFAEGNASTALCYMMHNVALMCVMSYGSDQMKETVVKDVVEKKRFLALAYSEFGTGTHFYKSEIKVRSSDNRVTFNGVKSMVTSAENASYYLVIAPSINVKDGVDNWLFPLGTPGLTFQMELWDGLGMRGNISCPMKIDDVTLDESWRIGAEGTGLEQVLTAVAPPFVLGLAAIYAGVCQNLLDIATRHAKQRVYPDGQALCNIETVQIHLANIYARAQASKLFALEAARAAVAGEADALAKIIASRVFASESVIECGRLAMRVGGGKAYNKHTEIERLLRDAYAGQIMAPSVDVLLVWLGKALTDQPIP